MPPVQARAFSPENATEPPPAAAASAMIAERSSVPLQAPMETQFCTWISGRKRWLAASNFSLPRDCEKRCTEGVQPAETTSASMAILRLLEPPLRPTVIEETRRRPAVL
ncbi:hypothetical protein D3C72_2170070 [compost metagenome]